MEAPGPTRKDERVQGVARTANENVTVSYGAQVSPHLGGAENSQVLTPPQGSSQADS